MDQLTVLTWRVPRVAAAVVEAATVPEQRRDEAVRALREAAALPQVVYVPTCQRVVFALLNAPDDAAERLRVAYAEKLGRDVPAPERFRGEDAFQHLAEAASSLDSLVVGEPQVLGQFKSAVQRAEESGDCGPALRHVMSLVLRTAKAVRSETALFQGKVSLLPLTVDLVAKHLEGNANPRAAVLGTGQIGLKMLELLRQVPGMDLHVVSRSLQRAEEISASEGGTPHGLESFLADPPEGIDVLALALPVDAPVLRAEHLARLGRPRDTLVLDLAIPRNVEAPAEPVPGVRIVQMDDLARVSADARAGREAEVAAARLVLDREIARIRAEYAERKLAHDLARLAERFDEVAKERWTKLPAAEAEDPQLAKWYAQTVRALLHEATAAVKRVGCQERTEE